MASCAAIVRTRGVRVLTPRPRSACAALVYVWGIDSQGMRGLFTPRIIHGWAAAVMRASCVIYGQGRL